MPAHQGSAGQWIQAFLAVSKSDRHLLGVVFHHHRQLAIHLWFTSRYRRLLEWMMPLKVCPLGRHEVHTLFSWWFLRLKLPSHRLNWYRRAHFRLHTEAGKTRRPCEGLQTPRPESCSTDKLHLGGPCRAFRSPDQQDSNSIYGREPLAAFHCLLSDHCFYGRC